jgi:hypothetical protein
VTQETKEKTESQYNHSLYNTAPMNRFLIWFMLRICLSAKIVQAFSPSISKTASDVFHQRNTQLYESKEDNGNKNPLSSQSYLSHAMLRVPSVIDTLEYWKEKGGIIRVQKEKPAGINGELLSAMVELGCSSKDENEDSPCFALELVATDKENFQIGNAISYLGVSMLLQFQNNLLGVITGDKPESQGEEPNGLMVQSSASAPGDFLSRFALKSNDLETTEEFYTSLLGLESKAKDDKMLCLRYDNHCFTSGVPITLIFEAFSDKVEMGDCFDHIVIATNADIADTYEMFSQNEHCKIFMKPTSMFEKDVMGLIDPNGYKVILASG